MNDQPIAVVGLGAVLPGAVDAAEFWANVLGRKDLITEVPADRWLLADHYDPDPAAPDRASASRGAFLPELDFDPLAFGIPPHSLSAIDTTQLLALVVAGQALGDYGLDKLTDTVRDRTGVLLGCGSLELMNHMAGRLQRPLWLNALRANGLDEDTAERVCASISEQFVPWQEDTFPGVLSNVVAGRIANRFDLHGPNLTVDAACASSLAALSAAVAELQTGRCDLVLTGGVDTMNDPSMFLCFSKTQALSRTGDCRPFSEGADGTVLGEGLAMLVLRRLEDAERDGDRVYAVVRGVGSSSDGRGGAIYAPRPEGQARALRRAYDLAGYGPETVELVEAHGTGTRAGDAVEFAALREVFDGSGRTDRQWCALGSVKSQIGHTKYAAGAASLVKTVLALHHRVLPPTIKAEQPHPGLGVADSPFFLNSRARPWIRATGRPRRASVSGFGFGGSDFHVTLEEHRSGSTGPERPWRLALLSAAEPRELAAALRSGAETGFDVRHPARVGLVYQAGADAGDAEGGGAWQALRSAAADRIEAAPDTPFQLPQGCWYAVGRADPGQVAFLFPGQGAQYPGMGADLACWFPAARAVWDRAAALPLGELPLHAVAFPTGPVTDDQRERLAATEWAQPALAAHSMSLLAVLDGLGLRADRFAGHSFGELVALHAAGALGPDDLLRLARRRGELMRDLATEKSGMIALRADHATVAAVLAGAGEQAWLVNDNAPEQVVVAGTSAALERLTPHFTGRGITPRPLRVTGAFHSPQVAPAADGLLDFLRGLEVTAPARPVHSNTDTEAYPADPAGITARAARHLASPVRFREMVLAMRAAGVRTFVEVGPGARLSGLVRATVGDARAVPLDPAGREGLRGLLDALAQLAVNGVPFDTTGVTGPPPPAEPTPTRETTVRISGKNVGQPYPLERPAPTGASVPTGATVPQPPVTTEPVPARDHRDQDALLRTVRDLQQQTADAHVEFQRQLTSAHQEFLRTAESSLAVLLGGTPQQPEATALDPVAPMLPAAPTLPVTEPAPRPGTATVAEPPHAALLPAAPPPAAVTGDAAAAIRHAIAERTGFPEEILTPQMNLEADLGIDSIKRVEILAALRTRLGDTTTTEPHRLRTIADLIQNFTPQTEPPAEAPAEPPAEPAPLTRSELVAEPVAAPGLTLDGLGEGPLAVVVGDEADREAARALVDALARAGVAATVADRVPEAAAGVVFLALTEPPSARAAVDLHVAALAAAKDFAGPRARLFVTVQDSGGDFGLTGAAPARVWTSGLAALVRTVAREWPEVTVKAIDCAAASGSPQQAAARIAAELLNGGSHPEVGLTASGARLVLRIAPSERQPVPAALGPDSVVVVTGGARGVTAQAVRALARAHRPRLLLLGRTPLVDEPEGLADATDRRELVRLLAARGSAAPIAEAASILACREIRSTLADVAAHGSEVRYAAADIQDEAAVRARLADVRSAWGPITGLVHGAGVLADAKIADKDEQQVRRVFGPKLIGLDTLLRATREDPLELLLAFSSVAGVFGNAGQSDYAMANTVLDHLLGAEQANRPDALVRAIAWGPWTGGMVDADLAERFARAGIHTIGLDAGARALVAEACSAGPVRVILEAGRGFDLGAGRAAAGLVRVDRSRWPQLADHQVGGRPVLPLAFALEWLLRATTADTLSDVRVLRALPLPELSAAGHTLRVLATEQGLDLRHGEDVHVRAREGGTAAPGSSAPGTAAPGSWPEPAGLTPRPLRYDGDPLFHGPAFQALAAGTVAVGADGATATVRGLADLGWPGPHWRVDPAALDGCLQLALLWARERIGGRALPMGIGEVRIHRPGPLPAPVRCVLRAGRIAAPTASCDLALVDPGGTVLAELLGVELVNRPA